MRQFIHDMINMTEGQKLLHYWWLYLTVFVVLMAAVLWVEGKR